MQQPLEFQLRHIKLRGIGFGDPTKPMILALHGWLDNAASFQPVSEYLDDYYIVAIDLAGHGLSAHRGADAHYHIVDFVHDLHELVISQNWQNFILLGHSLGGIIASMYASSFSEKIAKLICIEALGPLTKNALDSPNQLRESILSRLDKQQASSKRPKNLQQVIRARAIVGEISTSSAELLVKRNTSQRDGVLLYNTDRRLRTLSSLRMTEEQAEAFIKNIKCAVLLITGEQGFESMLALIETRLAWLKHGQHVSCQGNHHLHMDNPKEVVKNIIRFLQQVD